jgi:hypothetical protein
MQNVNLISGNLRLGAHCMLFVKIREHRGLRKRENRKGKRV